LRPKKKRGRRKATIQAAAARRTRPFARQHFKCSPRPAFWQCAKSHPLTRRKSDFGLVGAHGGWPWPAARARDVAPPNASGTLDGSARLFPPWRRGRRLPSDPPERGRALGFLALDRAVPPPPGPSTPPPASKSRPFKKSREPRWSEPRFRKKRETVNFLPTVEERRLVGPPGQQRNLCPAGPGPGPPRKKAQKSDRQAPPAPRKTPDCHS